MFKIDENLQVTFACSMKTTHPNLKFKINKALIMHENGLFSVFIVTYIKMPKVDMIVAG